MQRCALSHHIQTLQEQHLITLLHKDIITHMDLSVPYLSPYHHPFILCLCFMHSYLRILSIHTSIYIDIEIHIHVYIDVASRHIMR